MGYPEKASEDTVSFEDWNEIAGQGVMAFADATARDAASIPDQAGRLNYLADVDRGQWFDGAAWYNSPAGAKAGQVSATSFGNNAWSAVPNADGIAGTGNFEHSKFWDAGANQRLTVPAASGAKIDYDGIYIVTQRLVWTAHATGRRGLRLILSGVTPLAQTGPTVVGAAGTVEQFVVWVGQLFGGQYVEGQAYQDSGAALNGSGASLTMARLGFF